MGERGSTEKNKDRGRRILQKLDFESLRSVVCQRKTAMLKRQGATVAPILHCDQTHNRASPHTLLMRTRSAYATCMAASF